MAYQFDFNAKNRVLRGRFTGRVDDEELTDYYHVATLLSKSLRPHAGITDFSCAVVSWSSSTIKKLAKLPPAMRETSQPRFIVAPSDHLFGLARMFQMAGEATRPNLHVTRSAEEVWKTLGLQSLEFEPLLGTL
jgi:hypothetical protein